MNKVLVICTECPNGCEIEVTLEGNDIIKIEGQSCPRGDMYARNEITCPRRVLTSTVKCRDGKVLPCKTDKPIKKEEIFNVMSIVNNYVCDFDARIGDILIKNISEDINLIATDNKR